MIRGVLVGFHACETFNPLRLLTLCYLHGYTTMLNNGIYTFFGHFSSTTENWGLAWRRGHVREKWNSRFFSFFSAVVFTLRQDGDLSAKFTMSSTTFQIFHRKKERNTTARHVRCELSSVSLTLFFCRHATEVFKCIYDVTDWRCSVIALNKSSAKWKIVFPSLIASEEVNQMHFSNVPTT